MLTAQNAQLKEQITNLQNEFDFQRAQLTKEIEGLNEECDKLMRVLEDKDGILSAQNEMIMSLKGQAHNHEPNSDFRSAHERMEVGERTELVYEEHFEQHEEQD